MRIVSFSIVHLFFSKFISSNLLFINAMFVEIFPDLSLPFYFFLSFFLFKNHHFFFLNLYFFLLFFSILFRIFLFAYSFIGLISPRGEIAKVLDSGFEDLKKRSRILLTTIG